MGLKYLDIFKGGSTRSVSFTGISGAEGMIDKQDGGECWIEAIENLAQLYLFPLQIPASVSPILRKTIKARVENSWKEHSETIEEKIREGLVDDFLYNKGNTYGYFIKIKDEKSKRFRIINATHEREYQMMANGTAMPLGESAVISKEHQDMIKKNAKDARVPFKKKYPSYEIDDNVGEYTIYPTEFGLPRTEAEKNSMCDGIAFYRIIHKFLGIPVEFQSFDELEIRKALAEDRPVLFRMAIEGIPNVYGNHRGGHVVVIIDYKQDKDKITYVIMDSNAVDQETNRPFCYELTGDELSEAAKLHKSYGSKYQLLIPDNATPWNRIMGVI